MNAWQSIPPVARALRVARAACGLSQREAAQRARIHSDRYWRIEKGYATARADELQRLAAVVGVDIRRVVTLVEDISATSTSEDATP